MDNNLDFTDHISNICKTANQKLNHLFRVSAKWTQMNVGCWLIFLLNLTSVIVRYLKKDNKIQERYLRLMTNNYELS